MDEQIQTILTNTYFYAGILTTIVVGGLCYVAYHNRRIKPKPLKLAEQECYQWIQLQYGNQKGWLDKFLKDFAEFEHKMKYRSQYTTDYEWRTLGQYLSPKNKLSNPDFIERVSIFMTTPFLVQGSIKAARL